MSLIKAAGAGEQSTGFYKLLLDQSLKFNDDDSQYLTRTPTSAGNRDVWTWSCWLKHTDQRAVSRTLFSVDNGSASNYYLSAELNTNGELSLSEYTGSAYTYRYAASPYYRDPSAWMNVVWAVDTTQGTAANRVKLYVNGVQVTDFRLETDPSQNADTLMNSTNPHYIGCTAGQSSGSGAPYRFYDGYLAEINFIDGTQLTADSFGETKDGIWIPKDTSGLTFGTNGFHLTFKDDVVSEGFNTVTYKGNGGTQSISGVGFSPGLVWGQARSNAVGGELVDVVRGNDKWIEPYTTDAEATDSSRPDFDADGFTIGNSSGWNNGSYTYVTWCWEAGGTPTADNSAGAGATPTSNSVKIDGSNLGSALAGTIPATRLSANTSRGFSIVSYTGTGGTKTVGHGLGTTPAMVIVKSRSASSFWKVWHKDLTSGNNVILNDTAAQASYNNRVGTNNTASVVEVIDGTSSVDNVNDSGGTYVMYSFAEVSGYSKFGSYSGSGSSGKAVTGLGFRPAFLMVKRTDSTSNWAMYDNTRSTTNPRRKNVWANLSDEEYDNSAYDIDFDADGFTLQTSDSQRNASSGEYIYMAFADTREAAFFKDVTTNGNHWTPVNLDYRDSVPDVPTNSFCTANPLHKRLDGTVTVSEGNLQISAGSGYGGDNRFAGTTGVSSGKWYFEMLRTDATGLGNQTATGVFDADTALSSGAYSGNGTNSGAASNEWALTDRGYACNTSTYTNLSGTIGTVAQNKVVQVAVDMDNKKIWFGIDNTFSGDPAAGSGEAFSNLPTTILPMLYTAQSTQVFNFGQDSSFAGNKSTANANADGNGHGSFAYAPPSGYLALCSQNLPDAAIIDGTENFNTVLYTGNAGTQSITGVGFDPDFTWAKNRASASYHHELYDTVRGDNKRIFSSQTDAEATGYLQFISDGFSLTSGGGINANSNNHVAWNWLAGTAFSNDASATGVGTIDSSGQVNTTAGFSIVSYTGNSSTDGQTVAHGLSSAPEMVIIKNRSNARNWRTYHSALGATKYINLDETAAAATYGSFNDTAPTSTVFSTTDSDADRATNYNSDNYIAYCFHSVEGYSKVGSYVGNGSSDGPFVYTGMAVSWVMIKASSTTGNWFIVDTVRDPFNPTDDRLYPNLSNAESDATALDSVSNGFKVRNSWSDMNTNGQTYIFLAFASQPAKFSNAR
jgi:hypothetical protein